jgi:hypothetical protein
VIDVRVPRAGLTALVAGVATVLRHVGGCGYRFDGGW